MRYIKTFEDFINEKYTASLGLKKNKWSGIEKADKKELEPEFFDLISTAYAEIGGHLKVKSKEDVFKDPKWNYWKMIDIDEDPEADLIVFGQKGKYGIKYSGVGHDGQKISKRKYLDDRGKDLKVNGFYGEVSKKFAEILLKKYDVPTVDNEDAVRKILKKKDIVWHGAHPTKPDMPGNGWYERGISGNKQLKILVGRPKI